MDKTSDFGEWGSTFGSALQINGTSGGFGLAHGFGDMTFGPVSAWGKENDDGEEHHAKPARRRMTMCTELSQRYEYRRAFSEVKLLEAMTYETLQQGVTYNFLTGGDVDSLSYLKVVLNQHDLDYMLCSTWCMAAEDVLQLQEWWKARKLKRFDMYLGEIFPNSYRIEWQMVRKFYEEHPEAGRVAVFRNHSKVYAGCNEAEGFYFGIQTSANINTNPRTENGIITIDKGIFEFYKQFFDGINSFVKY